jgi:biopolymer transport protein ExbD
VGVPVNLPRTHAAAIKTDKPPLNVSIQDDGAIYLEKDRVVEEDLADRVKALAAGDNDRPIHLSADGRVPYETVAEAMADLQTAGFSKITMVTTSAAPRLRPR